MENKYNTAFAVPCYDTDASFRMKPSAFMDHAQEIAYAAAKHFGFGYETLGEHSAAWVLSRMHIIFERAPLWRENVRLETWHKGLDGLFFNRDFRMTAEDGSPAVLATSAWIVIDTATRRLVRSADVLRIVPDTTVCLDNAIEEQAPKIIMPREGREDAGTRVVSYGDVDIVGHTNNARYMAWAMDAVDYSDASSHPVREAWINFNHETRPGDTIALSRLRLNLPDGGVEYYVEGTLEGRSAFTVKILFA